MRRVIGVIAVGVLTAAACGGGDDASQTTDTATAATDPPATDPPATDPPSTDPPATDPPATDPPNTDPPSTDPPAVDPPVVVASEDGALAIEVSAADAERVNPSIRILDRSEWPPELAGSDEQSGVVIYELEPDGATFDEPVVVTRALDVASFGPDMGQFDVPLVVMVTQDDDGQFELLGDLEAMRVGDTLLATASTTHFSPIITTSINTIVSFPVGLTTLIGLPSDGVVDAPADPLRWLNQVGPVDYGTLPVVSVMDVEAGLDLSGLPIVSFASSGEEIARSQPVVAAPKTLMQAGTATGADAATALHRIFTEVDPSPTGIADVLKALGIDQLPADLRLKASLVIGSNSDEDIEKQFEALRVMAEEAGFTMQVVHSPFGPFPSFSRKMLEMRQLPDGYGVASVTLSGGLLEGSVVDKALMEWEGDAYTAETGLSSYGPVDEAVVVGTEDDVQEFIDDPTVAWPGDWRPRRLGSPMPFGVTIEPFVVTADEEMFFARVDRSF